MTRGLDTKGEPELFLTHGAVAIQVVAREFLSQVVGVTGRVSQISHSAVLALVGGLQKSGIAGTELFMRRLSISVSALPHRSRDRIRADELCTAVLHRSPCAGSERRWLCRGFGIQRSSGAGGAL
jgi:hypothetical protein